MNSWKAILTAGLAAQAYAQSSNGLSSRPGSASYKSSASQGSNSTTTIHVKTTMHVTQTLTVKQTVPSATAPRSTALLSTAPNTINATDCQQQLVAWSSATSQIYGVYYTNTTSSSNVTLDVSETVTYGTAAPYTTIDGFPHVSDNFTGSSTALLRTTSYTTTELTSLVESTPLSNVNKSIPASPTCTINPSSCDALFSAYRSDLGTKITATGPLGPVIPYITPAPTDSPRCSITRTDCTAFRSTEGCTISGQNVQLFYWPQVTQAPSASIRNGSVVPRTFVTGNITMTSPSYYLSFDYLEAFTSIGDYKVCPSNAIGGGALSQVGSRYSGRLLALNPKSVSTLERLVSDPAAAVSAMHGTDLAQYLYWARTISGYYKPVTARALTVSDLAQPAARPYYLRPNVLHARGCAAVPEANELGCNTIFDNEYNAQLSLPAEIISIDPSWATCVPRLEGVYDPPIALTTQSSAADITQNSPIQTTTTATPAFSFADPSTAVTATAVPDILSTPTTANVAIPVPVATRSSTTVSSSVIAAPPHVEQTQSTAAEIDPPITTQSIAAANPQPVTLSTSPNVKTDPTTSADPQTVAFSTPAQQTASNALQALTQPTTPVTSATPVAVITAGSSVVTASSVSGNVIIGGTTISSGQATVVNGATISNAGSGVVVQPTAAALAAPAAPAAPAKTTPVAVVGSQTVVANPSGVVVAGSTLTQGQATTIAGTPVSVGSTGVVIGSTTFALPSVAATPALPIATVAGQTVSANPSGVVVAGSTLTQGQATTINGTPISLGASNVVIGSSTVALPGAATTPAPVATVAGQTIAPQSNGAGVVIGSTTLTAGQITTISGTVVSVGSTAVVIGSSTIPLSTATPFVSTISGSSVLEVGTIAIPLTGDAASITSAGVHTASVVTTLAPSITVGGSVITANPSGQFVISGQTLTPGSSLTVSGTTYSLAPSDSYVVVNGKTTTLVRTSTSTILVTYTVKPTGTAGASGPARQTANSASSNHISMVSGLLAAALSGLAFM